MMYCTTKVFTNVQTEAFNRYYAEYMSVSNMGQDPATTSYDYLCSDGGEVAEAMEDELQGWLRVARAITKVLIKQKKPLTIAEAEVIWRADSKKLVKLYSKKR